MTKNIKIDGVTIDQADFHYMQEAPDPNFSAERNRAVIAGTIKKYNEMQAKRKKEFRGQLEERTDAVATFLKHKDMGKSTSVEQYFGAELKMLRAQKILMKVLDKRNKTYKLEEV